MIGGVATIIAFSSAAVGLKPGVAARFHRNCQHIWARNAVAISIFVPGAPRISADCAAETPQISANVRKKCSRNNVKGSPVTASRHGFSVSTSHSSISTEPLLP
eukprot:1210604-Rhodomonas_salina.2